MITGAQIRMARAALKWGVRDLAERAHVSTTTITGVEGEKHAQHAATLTVIEQALRAAGIEFIAEDGRGPGVRLRSAPKRKGDRHTADRLPKCRGGEAEAPPFALFYQRMFVPNVMALR
jgi:transcriptional regulator with XRE-family HTH domain